MQIRLLAGIALGGSTYWEDKFVSCFGPTLLDSQMACQFAECPAGQ